MRRREFVSLLSGTVASWSLSALAQTSRRVKRVGFLTVGGGPLASGIVDGVGRNLASRGYVSDNLLIERRSADGDAKQLPDLAQELVKIPVDVLLTASYPAARAAKEATTVLPIVVTGAGDPVESGLVTSLARPGGNITGVSDVAAELSPKRLEYLKAAKPNLKKVAMLWNADDLGMTLRYRASAKAAVDLNITVQSLGVREPDEFDQAFSAMNSDMPDGILMVSDSLMFLNRRRVFEFAAAHRLPAIYETEFWVRDGGLMSYGPDGSEIADRAAALVDRVLKGDHPADLPFERPTRFRFVINRKTANLLGLPIPQDMFALADDVIE